MISTALSCGGVCFDYIILRGENNMKIPKIRKLPSGSYFCQLRIDGKSVSITDENKDVVEAKAMAIKAGVIKARTKHNITVGQAVDDYIKARDGVKSPSTIAEYKKTRKNHFQSIMTLPIDNLTQKRFQQEVTNLSKIRSPKTVRNVTNLIYSAVKESCPDVDFRLVFPAPVKYDYAIPTSDDLKKILTACKGTSIEAPVVLAVWLGLRMSEIRGIKKEHIKGDVLHVCSAVVTVDRKPITKGTKTFSGDRKIKLSPYVAEVLNKTELPIKINDRTIYHRFVSTCNGLDLSCHYRFHDLRHAQASVGLALGVPDKYMQERMGHATNNMLKTIYQHTMTEKTDQFASAIDGYFNTMIANKTLTESKKDQ